MLSDNFDYNRFIELYNLKFTGTLKVKITIVTGFGNLSVTDKDKNLCSSIIESVISLEALKLQACSSPKIHNYVIAIS